MTRIVCISDTHSLHRAMTHKIPDGDILVHAGDCTNDMESTRLEDSTLPDFLEWFSSQPHKHKIFIAGNHDWVFQKNPDGAEKLFNDHAHPSVRYLEDRYIVLDGIKFYGSPWQPEFYNWAFNLPRDGYKIAEKWAAIPNDTDVLITHGPPHEILDASGWRGENAGCKRLMERLRLVRPKAHVFGHIHHGRGATVKAWPDLSTTQFVNACICNEAYKPVGQPFIVEL